MLLLQSAHHLDTITTIPGCRATTFVGLRIHGKIHLGRITMELKSQNHLKMSPAHSGISGEKRMSVFNDPLGVHLLPRLPDGRSITLREQLLPVILQAFQHFLHRRRHRHHRVLFPYQAQQWMLAWVLSVNNPDATFHRLHLFHHPKRRVIAFDAFLANRRRHHHLL